jgi:hypothetical protein
MKKFISICLLAITLLIPSLALAANPTEQAREYIPPIVKPSLLPGPTFNDENRRTGSEVTKFVTEKALPQISARLITLIAVAAMIGIIYAGVSYFAAAGDADKATSAKNIAIYSVVGLVIALMSFTIVQIITLLPLNSL